jgi:tripartite ATP-independent transporter DctP family solute receptor
MNSITRRGALAATLAAPFLGGVAAAQPRVPLRLGWTTGDGARDPYALGARAFKEEAERRSDGRIEVQLFPNRALGDERPMLDGMRLGTVDMGIITNAVVAQVEPAFQINDMPFLFRDEAQAHAVLDAQMGRSLAQRLDGRGIVALGYMEGGFRQMINNVRPINAPSDVRGVKFRVLQSPIYVGLFNALGGTAVPMAWGETFTAVQQGAVDGLEIPIAVIESSRYNEVTRYLSLTNHIYSMIALTMAKRSFDRLPDELKRTVRDAAAAATATQRRQSAAAARDLLEVLRGRGMQVNAVADTAPFRQAVLPMYESFRGQIGADIVQEALAAAR